MRLTWLTQVGFRDVFKNPFRSIGSCLACLGLVAAFGLLASPAVATTDDSTLDSNDITCGPEGNATPGQTDIEFCGPGFNMPASTLKSPT